MHFLRSFLLATAAISSSLAIPLSSQEHGAGASDDSVPSPATRDVSSRDKTYPVVRIDGMKFMLKQELGRGAFGVVYAADSNPYIGREAAVKQQTSDQDMLHGAALISERITDWTNIIQILRYGSLDKTQYIAMVRADRNDMEAWIQKGQFIKSERDLKTDFMDVVRGLAVMHSSNLAHNDAHSGNVVFVDGASKLTDFDLVTKGQFQRRICGRRDIRGPEAFHLTSADSIDAFKNDVWSAGVTLIRMMTKRNPWKNAGDDFAQDIWRARRSDRSKLLKTNFPTLSFELCKVLAHVFVPQEERYSANEFYAALGRVDRWYSSHRRSLAIRAEPTEEDDLDTPENYACSFNPGNGTAPKTTSLGRMAVRTTLY